MTPSEIDIAVAECCGWKNVRLDYANGSDTFKSFLGEKPGFVNGPPFYSSSRDAMAGAMGMLSDDEWDAFTDVLSIGIKPAVAGCVNDLSRHMLSLSPKQLATAFLKAKGKL